MKQLTQEELEKLQSILQKYEEASFRVGQYTIEIENLKAERKEILFDANQAITEREKFLKHLETVYGENVQINPVTGEIKE
jgi:hypothetical protein